MSNEIIANSPHAFKLLTTEGGGSLSAISLISSVGWGLGYFGMPHILTRFMAIGSVDKIPLARRIALGWTAISLAGAIGVGLVGIAVFGQNGLADSETVFIALIILFSLVSFGQIPKLTFTPHWLPQPPLQGLWGRRRKPSQPARSKRHLP